MGQTVSAAFTRHVDDLWGGREDLPHLIQNAELVRSVLDSPGYLAISEVLDAETAALDRKLSSDRVLEQAEYARLHGRRAALRAFEDAAEAIISRATANLAKANQESEGESSGEGR